MQFSDVSSGTGYEILASENYNAIPIQVATPGSGTVVKAGTPLTAAGAAALDGTSAAGILLYDVDTAINPNGALVVAGIVDWALCVENSGATATAATMKSALPAIEFRTNIEYVLPPEIADTITMVNSSGTVTITAYAGAATLKWKETTTIPCYGEDVSTWTTAALNTTMSGVTTGDSVCFAQVDANGKVIAAEVIPVPAAA